MLAKIASVDTIGTFGVSPGVYAYAIKIQQWIPVTTMFVINKVAAHWHKGRCNTGSARRKGAFDKWRETKILYGRIFKEIDLIANGIPGTARMIAGSTSLIQYRGSSWGCEAHCRESEPSPRYVDALENKHRKAEGLSLATNRQSERCSRSWSAGGKSMQVENARNTNSWRQSANVSKRVLRSTMALEKGCAGSEGSETAEASGKQKCL